jgi:hypothetical protein
MTDNKFYPINLDFNTEDSEELHEEFAQAVNSPEFNELILEQGFGLLKQGVEEDLEEIDLFYLPFYRLYFTLEKTEYKPFLQRMLKGFESKEDYVKCREIQTLIKRL